MADDIKLRVGVEGLNDIAKVVTETEKLEKKVRLLATSFERGNLTNKAYFKGLNQQIVALRKLGYDYKTAQSYVHGLAKSTREAIVVQDQFAAAAQASQKAMHRNGVVMQQAGYQVGDFLVQVQSGTNAFVAFGQQATQLVGVMGMLNPSLIGLSAGLGIAIPLITALGAAWMKSREAAKNASDGLSDLEDRLKSLDDTIKDFVLTKRAAEAGVTLDELIGGEGIKQAEEDLAKARTQLEAITRTTEAMAYSGNLALRVLNYGAQAAEATKLADAVKAVADAEERLYNLRLIAAQDEIDYVKEERQSLGDRLAIARLIVQHGEDSAEVKAEELAQERRLYEAELRRNVASETTVRSLMAQYDLINKLAIENQAMAGPAEEYQKIISDLNDDIGEAAVSALRFAGVDLTTGVSEAAKAAAVLAANLGVSLNAAYSMINLRGGDSPTASRGNAMAELQRRRDAALGITNQANLEEIPLPSWLTGKGGGSSSDKTPYIEQLKAEAQYKSEIVGLSDEEARRREILFELSKREETATDAQIQQILDLEAATTKATEAEKQRENMMNAVQSNLESAMMSLVDGSMTVVDAFRSMLRNILLEIYKQQVAEKTANFITSMFMANGGAFNKGVQMFADGGVVGSPTLFGHSGGVGMMGEAGPEAIMPLKRGANGKLGVQVDGSQGNVVVNQTFNFSANGDESVKKLIAQAAPQIAQLTQKQIVDSRRRGGSMKVAFG